MKALIAVLIIIVAIASGFTGYMIRSGQRVSTTLFSTTIPKIVYTTITSTSTVTLTTTHKEEITFTITKKRTETKILNTTTTLTKNEVQRKFVTATKTETKTVVKPVVISSYQWIKPTGCNYFSREVLSIDDIICALSQWQILKNLTRMLEVKDHPLLTGIRIGEWISHNIKYVTDEAAFHEPNYVQLPIETLQHGFGDCEDLSLLEAAMLLGTHMYDKVIVAYIKYDNIKVDHVEAGIEYNGKYYIIPWINNTYPMELNSDYYGYSVTGNAKISNVTLYVARLTSSGSFEINKVFISKSSMKYIYPPPITHEDLRSLKNYINHFLSLKGFNTLSYPDYLNDLWDYMSLYLPEKELPIKPPISYFEYVIPIDWYSNKSPKWINWRVGLLLNSSWKKLQSELIIHYKGCATAFVKNATLKLEGIEYEPDGSFKEITRPTPSLVIVLMMPEACDVPKTRVELGNETIITLNTLDYSNVGIEFYSSSPNPLLGVIRKGYKLEGIPYITADFWGIKNGKTVIEFNFSKVREYLSPGTYELIVWFNSNITYVKILNVK